MNDKCPYCYRLLALNTWKNNPILLPAGSPYKWSSETVLVNDADITKRKYKGVYQVKEIETKEIQDALKILEEQYLLPINRTTFSPLNISGKFQVTGKHIKEMRDSVEKLLTKFSSNKTKFFNYDDEGNHIIRPGGDRIEWTDPITNATDLQKFQVKAIHIEDLRHYIGLLWQETWDYDGIHPLTNQSDSWHYPGETWYWGLEYKYFSTDTIFGNNVWDIFENQHVAQIYMQGEDANTNVEYTLIQNNSILSLNVNVNTVASSPGGYYFLHGNVDYAHHIRTGIDNATGNSHTKLKIDGFSLTGNNRYMVVFRVDCVFQRKIFAGYDSEGHAIWNNTSSISKSLVLATYAGVHENTTTAGARYNIDPSTGYLRRLLTVNAHHWYEIANGEYNLVDLLNYEYDLTENKDPVESAGYIYVSQIDMSQFLIYTSIYADIKSQPPEPPHTVSDDNSVAWSVDTIQLI